jgi:histidinol-phosphate phosphatase family protein
LLLEKFKKVIYYATRNKKPATRNQQPATSNQQPATSNKQPVPGKTLFLDRDGVINRRLVKRYVKNWEEFEFLPGVLESIPLLNRFFQRMVVITNQRGIGLGLMTAEELENIHKRLLETVKQHGGHIDRIYFCAKQYDELPNCRKPDPFMAFQAQRDFPDIDFNRSVMVGDQPGDIAFGKNLGMTTVWIPNEPGMVWEEKDFSPDLRFSGLKAYADNLVER